MIAFLLGFGTGTMLLLYGVSVMARGLESAAGGLLEKTMVSLTANPWRACLTGTVVTALVQSSTAVTVVTVGLVNAGLLTLSRAVGIVYGANLGTTMTAQILAYSLRLNIFLLGPYLFLLGLPLFILLKKSPLRYLGKVTMGIGMLFSGLLLLNAGVPYLENNASLKSLFVYYGSIPFVGIVLGFVSTALVHSSSATVGIVMLLGMGGLLDLPAAIAIMLGDNVGTCVTAQLASLGGRIQARRVAWAHTLYNLLCVLLALPFLPAFSNLIRFVTNVLQPGAGLDAQIANAHTIFNLLGALIFLPLTKYYVRFLEWLV